jgi:hypothetical protein
MPIRETNRILARLNALEEDIASALNELADPIQNGWKPKKWLKSKSADKAVRSFYIAQMRIWVETRHQQNKLNKADNQPESEAING